jgi:hypothetical protein
MFLLFPQASTARRGAKERNTFRLILAAVVG